MEFCKSCGSLMGRISEGMIGCSCGCSQPLASRNIREKVERSAATEVVDRQLHPLATFDHVCSRCGYGKARLVSKGIMVSDEDEHIAFVCGKCGYHDKGEGLKVT
jgi:DNA-directed RNA polymerase subunit M/transcription elongation factor TFIIS